MRAVAKQVEESAPTTCKPGENILVTIDEATLQVTVKLDKAGTLSKKHPEKGNYTIATTGWPACVAVDETGRQYFLGCTVYYHDPA